MPLFEQLTDKVRKDPMGPRWIASLRSNVEILRGLAGREHALNGEHNTPKVARVCRRITWSGAAYGVSPSSSDITAVSNPAAGCAQLTLAASRFSLDGMNVQVNPGVAENTKPLLASVEVISATSIKVRIQRLFSALGGGNLWSAYDGAFDIAIHDHAIPWATQWASLAAAANYGDTNMAGGVDRYNGFVQEAATLQTQLLVGHTSVGVHNVREVAKSAALVRFNAGGTGYSLVYSTSGAGLALNRVGAGIVEVTYTALTAPQSAFVSPDYTRLNTGGASGDFYAVNAYESNTAKHTVYIYKFDFTAKTWALADGDFWIAIHGS